MPSVSQAKNIMRRAISEIVDPGLTTSEKEALWEHFRSCCAFCEASIERASRTGHIDHLNSDGGNGPSNRVLACARCNGDEKRERSWQEFLVEKSADAGVLAERRARIEEWVAQHTRQVAETSPAVAAAYREAEQIIDEFHAACTKLRDAVKNA